MHIVKISTSTQGCSGPRHKILTPKDVKFFYHCEFIQIVYSLSLALLKNSHLVILFIFKKILNRNDLT